MSGLTRMIALAGASMAISFSPPPALSDPFGGVAPDYHPKRGKGQNNRRGKGKHSPPKRRPNRLLISKRVRRKHRRAA